jgi:serine/threonine-protein kinase
MMLEPAPIYGNMVSVKLDLNGNLIKLHAVPSKKWPAQELNLSALFAAAGLNLAEFTEAVPSELPPDFADTQRAWEGRSPHGTDLPIKVEAAFYHGKPIYFEVLHDRRVEKPDGANSQGMLDGSSSTLAAAFELAMLLAAAFLGPRNLYRGSADRQGALRLALWSFALLMVVWLFESHHALNVWEELRLLTLGLAFACSWAALMWIKYIALEPYVRLLWPESLITWTRLLAGQWRDPRLGRDLLQGAFIGVVLGLLDMLGRVIPAWFGGMTPVPFFDWWIPNTFLDGYWVGNFLINLLYSFRWAFFDVTLFLLLRVLLRRTIPAAIVYIAVGTLLYVGTTADFGSIGYCVVAVLMQSLLLLLMARIGIFALVMAVFAWYCVFFPLTHDLPHNGIYALGSIMIMAGMLMAGYGFYTSGGARGWFGELLRV